MNATMEPSAVTEQPSPRTLRPGSLVYLWAPGEPTTERPTLVRVERSTVDTIVGVDLTPGAGRPRGSYAVGRSTLLGGLAWTWQLASEPEVPLDGQVERVDMGDLSIEERRELVFGPPGTALLLRLHSGDSIHGVISRVITADEEIRAVVVTGPSDHRGAIRHLVRYAEIGSVTFTGGTV